MRAISPLTPSTASTVLAIIAVGAVVTYLGSVLAPLLVAVFIFFMIRPIADALIHRGIRPWLAYLALFVAFVILFVAIARIVQQNAVAFRERLPTYRENLLGMANQLPGGEAVHEQAREALTSLFDMSVRDVLGVAIGPALSFLETSLFVIFYFLFILMSAAHLPARFRRAFERDQADQFLDIGRGIGEVITQYVKVKTLVSLGMATVASIIMWLFHVHYWPLWSFLFFILNYITYLGSLFACVPPIALALLQFPLPTAILVAALIAGNRLLWVDYVEIKFSGEHLNVDPVLLLLGIVYWGLFWGVVGMVLAVPMLVCLKIALQNFESTRKYATLMSER